MLGIKNYMEQCNYSFCREYATKAKVTEYIVNLEKKKKKKKKKKIMPRRRYFDKFS